MTVVTHLGKQKSDIATTIPTFHSNCNYCLKDFWGLSIFHVLNKEMDDICAINKIMMFYRIMFTVHVASLRDDVYPFCCFVRTSIFQSGIIMYILKGLLANLMSTEQQ